MCSAGTTAMWGQPASASFERVADACYIRVELNAFSMLSGCLLDACWLLSECFLHVVGTRRDC
eukprot:3896967-Lingulodinium_polyedra.AAC.1